MALNAKQRLFIEKYLFFENATQAAIDSGYSRDTAGSIGHELLKKPEIARAVAQGQEEKLRAAGITSEWILNGIAAIAEKSKNEFARLKALELLGKYKKLFTEKIEIEDKSSLAEKLNRFKSKGKA